MNSNRDFSLLLVSDGREAMAGYAQHQCICSFPSAGSSDQPKVSKGARGAVAATTVEWLLSVWSRDLRRDARQRARCADSGRPGTEIERQGSTLKRHSWPRRRMVGSTRKRAFGYARRAADLRVSAPARPGAALLHAPIATRPQRMSETGKRLTPACIPDWPAASSSRPA